ncbi:recombinase family protein [Bradyrhizobium oligotrophicum]|uniref:recombinase family protein n=1 Tax=Bradyrhizobium oligotrophicum TaxID=44255 RepID=UPI003EBCA9E6
MEFGYARVSTPGQTLESQLKQLSAAGCVDIYRDVASGARFDRRSLQALLKALKPGSTLVVTRLDRLARSTVDLLTILKAVTDRGCLFRSISEPWADTRTPAGRLMLTVLGGLAEFERELIRARTMEGRERAQRAGVRMGRKPILSTHQIAEIQGRKAAGESVRFLARSYGVSPSTISRVEFNKSF